MFARKLQQTASRMAQRRAFSTASHQEHAVHDAAHVHEEYPELNMFERELRKGIIEPTIAVSVLFGSYGAHFWSNKHLYHFEKPVPRKH